MTPAAKKAAPTVTGVSATDFIADPVAAVAKLKEEIRAEVRREIIGANLLFSALLYFLIQSERR